MTNGGMDAPRAAAPPLKNPAMPPYRLRNLHQPMNQATVRHSEAKLKEVMSLSDLMEDKLRERVHDETGGDDGVSSHHVAG